MDPNFTVDKKKGFTLMESVIAIGVVAVLLTTFLAVFGPATQGIRRAISAQDADRLSVALESELSILRESEASGDMKTAFNKAYDWLSKSSQGGDNRILLYNFKADPKQLNSDGTMEPLTGKVGPEDDYILTPAVRFVSGASMPSEVKDELKVASGPVFYVKTTQLIYDSSGAMVLGKAGVEPPHSGQETLSGSGADSYPEAVIAFVADFYLMKSASPEYLTSVDLTKLGRPLFSRNMAVRR